MDDDIEQQALAWRDRLLNDASGGTRREFDAWHAADARHAEAFEQQRRLASEIRTAGWRGVMPAPRAANRSRWLAYGLGGVAVTALALVLAPHGSSITTLPGRVATVMPALILARRLPDGSLVVLAAGADVVPDRRDARSARLLRGAARFIVVHDPAHPYRVIADGMTITARGTVFDVALTPTGARVALIEGRIDVAAATGLHPDRAKVVGLGPGETLDSGADEPAAATPGAAAITWVEVDGMTLGDLLTIAARGNAVRIHLADPTLATLRVTGRFDLSRASALAMKLAAALDLHVTRDADGLVLDRLK